MRVRIPQPLSVEVNREFTLTYSVLCQIIYSYLFYRFTSTQNKRVKELLTSQLKDKFEGKFFPGRLKRE
jgi:hypothetical protein